MAGFDGAVSRFENAVKNLETAAGRGVDNNGNGGILTGTVNKIAELIQSFAELSKESHLAAGTLGVVGGSLTAVKTVFGLFNDLTGGNGAATSLSGSAYLLGKSALALEAAATSLGARGGGGVAGTVAGGAAAGVGATVVSAIALGGAVVGFRYAMTRKTPEGEKSIDTQGLESRTRHLRDRISVLQSVNPLAPGAASQIEAANSDMQKLKAETAALAANPVKSVLAEQALGRINTTISSMEKLLQQINAVKAAAGALPGSGIGGANGIAGQRAGGGPVTGGKTYLVGERGPELFMPSGSGRILPNDELSGAGRRASVAPAARGGGPSSISITFGNIVVQSVQNASEIAEQVGEQLEAKIREVTRGLQADLGYTS